MDIMTFFRLGLSLPRKRSEDPLFGGGGGSIFFSPFLVEEFRTKRLFRLGGSFIQGGLGVAGLFLFLF